MSGDGENDLVTVSSMSSLSSLSSIDEAKLKESHEQYMKYKAREKLERLREIREQNDAAFFLIDTFFREIHHKSKDRKLKALKNSFLRLPKANRRRFVYLMDRVDDKLEIWKDYADVRKVGPMAMIYLIEEQSRALRYLIAVHEKMTQRENEGTDTGTYIEVEPQLRIPKMMPDRKQDRNLIHKEFKKLAASRKY